MALPIESGLFAFAPVNRIMLEVVVSLIHGEWPSLQPSSSPEINRHSEVFPVEETKQTVNLVLDTRGELGYCSMLLINAAFFP